MTGHVSDTDMTTNERHKAFFCYNECYNILQSLKLYLPFRIVYCEAYLPETAARLREKAIKQSGSILVSLLRRIEENLE